MGLAFVLWTNFLYLSACICLDLLEIKRLWAADKRAKDKQFRIVQIA